MKDLISSDSLKNLLSLLNGLGCDRQIVLTVKVRPKYFPREDDVLYESLFGNRILW